MSVGGSWGRAFVLVASVSLLLSFDKTFFAAWRHLIRTFGVWGSKKVNFLPETRLGLHETGGRLFCFSDLFFISLLFASPMSFWSCFFPVEMLSSYLSLFFLSCYIHRMDICGQVCLFAHTHSHTNHALHTLLAFWIIKSFFSFVDILVCCHATTEWWSTNGRIPRMAVPWFPVLPWLALVISMEDMGCGCW